MRFLRTITLSLLISSSMGSALLYPLVYLDYTLRRDYIAKVLCINRKKPITVCYGKCYLKKQLKRVKDQHEKDRKRHNNQSPELTFFVQDKQPPVNFGRRSIINSSSFGDFLKLHLSSPHLDRLLRPPQAA